MKGKIPIWQLRENISGVRIEKISDAFISSLFVDISKLHRNDHFICIVLTAGNAELLVDFKQVNVAQETLLILLPGQRSKVALVHQPEYKGDRLLPGIRRSPVFQQAFY